MNIDKDKLEALKGRILAEFSSVQGAFQEKGAKYFQRPLVLGGMVIFASYFYVFQTGGDLSNRYSTELDAARAIDQHAEEYQNLRLAIDTVRNKLPRTRNPDEWLTQSVRRTLREEGIDALETSAPKESKKASYRILTVTVKMQSNYHQVASWISRLERSKKLLFIKALRLRKDPERIGKNAIEVDVTTVIPVGGEGG
jgi:hypothetical protein